MLSIGLSQIQLILFLWVKIPCRQGCGPGWIDCTGTLPEQILTTTSQPPVQLSPILTELGAAQVSLPTQSGP